jgi:hypothetical protein
VVSRDSSSLKTVIELSVAIDWEVFYVGGEWKEKVMILLIDYLPIAVNLLSVLTLGLIQALKRVLHQEKKF